METDIKALTYVQQYHEKVYGEYKRRENLEFQLYGKLILFSISNEARDQTRSTLPSDS